MTQLHLEAVLIDSKAVKQRCQKQEKCANPPPPTIFKKHISPQISFMWYLAKINVVHSQIIVSNCIWYKTSDYSSACICMMLVVIWHPCYKIQGGWLATPSVPWNQGVTQFLCSEFRIVQEMYTSVHLDVAQEGDAHQTTTIL